MALRPNPTWMSQLGRYGVVVLLMGGALLAGIAYGLRSGQAQARASVSSEAAALMRNASALAEANNKLAAQAQQLQITESARAALASDLADAQQDLARSRESLAFFETLLTTNDRAHQVSFALCEFDAAGKGLWHYRLLVVQGVNQAPEFDGQLTLTALTKNNGKTARTEMPSQPVRVKHYQRFEGDLTLPAGVEPDAFEATLGIKDTRASLAQCQKKPGGV
ncbi:hypothetical protein WG78_16110 [Amantichitinum ursilacus]|uniref:Uncharacterized protein n=2 Tax=Amantichitinum ursilacus TaxID=857265 RepID=A0A0N0XH82_9NEIS|nr:hypothetical protein WG78_16110 [Amantichitinum ursilacus]